MASTGKKRGFGKPPANEITFGSSVTFNISRMKDFGIDFILDAYR
jgi:hypothetical protein